MKKVIVAIAALLVAVPVFAAAADPASNRGKDLCVLDSAKCDPTAPMESIQEKTARIEKELAKGSSVYSESEIRLLQERLDENRTLLTLIISP